MPASVHCILWVPHHAHSGSCTLHMCVSPKEAYMYWRRCMRACKTVFCCRRSAIEKLRTQNEQLKTDLLMENKFSVRPGDPFAQQLINRLQDEGDMLARKVRRAACVGAPACRTQGWPFI